jgi:hypothetical protein
MASTDTRSGFRLPWSSDRSQDDTAFHAAANDERESEVKPATPALEWPETDFSSRTGLQAAQPRPADDPAPPEEAPTVIAEQQVAEKPAVQPPAAIPAKKPTKLMADLAAAIRTTAETARDQLLGQLDTEANGIVELIRAQSDEGAVALRRKSDEDVAAIRDWAKAEIARVKEESETRIADRKHLLEQEIADHAAAIEDRCSEVQSVVTGYRVAMDAYVNRLHAEEDPARLATMAEAMPEAPTLESLTNLDDLPVQGAAARRAAAEESVAELDEAPEEEVEPAEAAAAADSTETAEAAEGAAQSDADGSESADEDEIMVSEDRIAHALGFADDAAGDAIDAEAAADTESDATIEGAADETGRVEGDDVPRWAAGETPEGFPEASESGDPVDRGAIMAALEAAAEAVVAAESAAESAETAEAAADVAETAAELVKGRGGTRDESDPEAMAALSARVDAGGFTTESYQDRLASLLPGHSDGGAASGEPRTTQVVVTGLVSVASIASFKRHLGRLAGVTAVAVASGPDGEFIFNVTHRPDVSFRDAIPTMPGFAARVVASGDGVVSVTAHDPETEG